ncbi:MAG: sterol desaturase family protein [Bacteroidia bacterium]|nr:sterol desaturase family protein [Bacteroidia bacterium]
MQDYSILFVIPFFFLLMGIEMLWARRKKIKLYRFTDTITNLNMGIGNQVFNLFIKGGILYAFVQISQHWAPFHQPKTWWSFVLCLLLFDFLFYWAHRWGHEINFFWGAHVVHHQSEEYNLSVALRQSWIHNLLAGFIFLPIPFLGFDPVIFGAAAGIDTVYQFWIHTKAVKKMPKWAEWLLNTPSHHRVHHGVNPKYIDKNHGGVFIIWDRLFGTFQAEEEEPTYGITTPLKSWNPVWANLHYYVEMWQKARKMTRFSDRLRVIFARPGWLPEELGGFQAVPEVDPGQSKYETFPGKRQRRYVLAQFVLLLAGMMLFVFHFKGISLFYQVVFFLGIISSMLICGAILEKKKWVIYVEYLRLALVAVALNTFYYFWYIDWLGVMLAASIPAAVFFSLWFTRAWWNRLAPAA